MKSEKGQKRLINRIAYKLYVQNHLKKKQLSILQIK